MLANERSYVNRQFTELSLPSAPTAPSGQPPTAPSQSRFDEIIRGMGRTLHTPLCDLLGMRYPILNAGIGSGAGAELAAAVSNAGGFGVLGSGSLPIELVAARIEKTRSLTNAPFGVNVIIAETDPGDDILLRDQIAAI